ncbi:signal peptidase I [Brevundimonas vesicularis]|uniref:signal peptidase I n=1 Tax=Brevundimonas vesicularis TaxID=41276 RepID=UPI0038D39F6F
MTSSRPTPRGEILSTFSSIAVALLIAILFRVVAFQPYTIPSSSMSPGLLTGDYILVAKYPYGWSLASLPGGQPQGTQRLMKREPQRGDVVVFRLPRDSSQVWIKRVIGLPGDQVQMQDGHLILNGQAVPTRTLGVTTDRDNPGRPVLAIEEDLGRAHPHVIYDGGAGLRGDDTGVIHVPAGHYLMMGDNRDNSVDGRWPAHEGVGLLPASHVIGRAEIVAWSWKPGSSLWRPWTWLNLRADRFMQPTA